MVYFDDFMAEYDDDGVIEFDIYASTDMEIEKQIERLKNEGFEILNVIPLDEGVDLADVENSLLYLALSREELDAIDNALANLGIAKVAWSAKPLEALRYKLELVRICFPEESE